MHTDIGGDDNALKSNTRLIMSDGHGSIMQVAEMGLCGHATLPYETPAKLYCLLTLAYTAVAKS